MQHQMKITLLILQRDQAEELIKREKWVLVSQVSKQLSETDLIRKANKSLLRYLANKEIDWVTGGTKMDTDGDEVNEDASIDDGCKLRL